MLVSQAAAHNLLASIVASLSFAFAAVHATDGVYNAQGEMSGEVTDTSVLLQTRLTAIPGPELDSDGDVRGESGLAMFEWSESEDFSSFTKSGWLKAEPEHDFIVRTQVTGLKPDTTYHYRLIFGEDGPSKTGPVRSFKTLPGAGSTAAVKFCMGSCMNYHKFMDGKKGKAGDVITATAEDKRLGFPAFAAMEALKPDFFIGTGDIVYYDNILNGPAQTLPELRGCWHEQFRFPRLVSFFAKTPGYWSKDDHDFRFNDSDNSSSKLPAPSTGIEIFREQMPIHPADDRTSPTYRTHRLNQHTQLWFTEGRDYRSPNKTEDGPQKTLWGAEQKAWLMRTLKESDAAWKIIISPTPMVGPDDASKQDNHTNLGGFRHEADEFFQWLNDNDIRNLLTFCGDRHWQFHSIHPSGVEEFACGALNDENSRVGVPPGSKKGTDPEGLIKQPYTYPEPTGGFLHVTSQENGGLVIEFRDDHGKILHTVTKTPKP
jgi:alkaline phosphatase D